MSIRRPPSSRTRLLAACALAGLLLLLPGRAAAQEIPRALSGLDPANGEAWIAPFLDALAPALTAGFFTSGGRGEGAGLGVRLTAGVIPAAAGTVAPVLPGSVVFDGTGYDDPYVVAGGGSATPSVSGRGAGAALVPRPGSRFEAALDAAGVPASARSVVLPDGLELSRAPLPAIEASLALRGLGVHLVGRFTPTVELFGELGDVSAFGAGVLVTVSRFVPASPVEIGLSAVAQKMDGADWLDASASAFGMVVSREVGPLRPYVHGLVTSADLELHWTVDNPAGIPLLPTHGSLVRARRSTGWNARAALGASFDAGPLGVSAEYGPGARDVLSVRLTLLGR